MPYLVLILADCFNIPLFLFSLYPFAFNKLIIYLWNLALLKKLALFDAISFFFFLSLAQWVKWLAFFVSSSNCINVTSTVIFVCADTPFLTRILPSRALTRNVKPQKTLAGIPRVFIHSLKRFAGCRLDHTQNNFRHNIGSKRKPHRTHRSSIYYLFPFILEILKYSAVSLTFCTLYAVLCI